MKKWRSRLMLALVIMSACLLTGSEVDCDLEDGEFEIDLEDFGYFDDEYVYEEYYYEEYYYDPWYY
jgi:hypothetical protein